MKWNCPSCGATHSADGMLSDVEARQALMLSAELPGELGALTLRYIGLFRPSARALSWSRVLTLLQELAPMIRSGVIRRDGRDWPAPPAAWRAGMQQMLEKRDRLQLPMKSHGYLLDIIAGGADKTEGAQERTVEETRRSGGRAPAEATSVGALLSGRRADPTSEPDAAKQDRHTQMVRNADVTLQRERLLRKERHNQVMTESEGVEFLRACGSFNDAAIYEAIEIQRGRTGQ